MECPKEQEEGPRKFCRARWIAWQWGASENNRKAKFYSITRRGLKQLARETDDWQRIAGVIGRVLSLGGQVGGLPQR